jgi:hypothetical protein
MRNAVNKGIQKSVNVLGHNIRITHKSVNLNDILYKSILHPPTRNGNCNLNGCEVNHGKLCFKSRVVCEQSALVLENSISVHKYFFHTYLSTLSPRHIANLSPEFTMK